MKMNFLVVCFCSCWMKVIFRTWRRSKRWAVPTWLLLVSLLTDRSALIPISSHPPWKTLMFFLTFPMILHSRASRSVRTAGNTLASWFCSLCPCRRRSNTSTRTRETVSSSGLVSTQKHTTFKSATLMENEVERLFHIFRFSPIFLQSQMN